MGQQLLGAVFYYQQQILTNVLYLNYDLTPSIDLIFDTFDAKFEGTEPVRAPFMHETDTRAVRAVFACSVAPAIVTKCYYF